MTTLGKFETWFSITLKQKGVSLSDWAESMCDPKLAGDKLCLYLLCRMYHKHALVHLKHHWWSTIQHSLPGDLNEILDQCHLEFVFVREWVFGEVKQIQKPLEYSCAQPKTNWYHGPVNDHEKHWGKSGPTCCKYNNCTNENSGCYNWKMLVPLSHSRRKNAMCALKSCPQQCPLLQSPQIATCHTTCVPDPPRQRPHIKPQTDCVP